MVSTNPVEVTGLQAEISALEIKRQELGDSFQAAIVEADASKLLSLGKEIQRIESEIEILEKRYARVTGEAVPNLKGIAAKNLKAAVSEAISTNIDQIRELVRNVWSLQSEQKLREIRLAFSPDDVTELPTISLVGGFHQVGTGTKSGATRKPREASRWIVPGEAEPVGRKGLILRYGPKYGQTVMFDKMTSTMREALSDAIAAGEGLAKDLPVAKDSSTIVAEELEIVADEELATA